MGQVCHNDASHIYAEDQDGCFYTGDGSTGGSGSLLVDAETGRQFVQNEPHRPSVSFTKGFER
ncbi:hypothetical protein FEM08_12140 [Flavobacterium gilvum]|nr:hypothetical protein FEM08_12140 [Flavobacterium gilvum]